MFASLYMLLHIVAAQPAETQPAGHKLHYYSWLPHHAQEEPALIEGGSGATHGYPLT